MEPKGTDGDELVTVYTLKESLQGGDHQERPAR